MPPQIIDVFNHCLPPQYVDFCRRQSAALPAMFERALKMPGMIDLDERLRIIEDFPGYQQILSLASPTIEALAPTSAAAEALAKAGNDSLSAWANAHPNHFSGFIASLPMTSKESALTEARRAVEELGALGVQLYTHIRGQALDQPLGLAVLEQMAALHRPVWLHPLRPASMPDYPDEEVSKYDLWWAFGWPHETSVCAGRLVFAGIFDRWPNLKIITHHAGGTLPMMAGRIGQGLRLLGTRYPPKWAQAAETPLKEPAIDAFRRFYADTATFGSTEGVTCAGAFFGNDKMLFASDFPFADIASSLRAAEAIGLERLHLNTQQFFNFKTK